MSWGKDDYANSLPIDTPTLVNKTANTSNRDAVYKNSTVNSLVNGLKVGVFPTSGGWVLRKEGTGGRSGRITNEILMSYSSDDEISKRDNIILNNVGGYVVNSSGGFVTNS